MKKTINDAPETLKTAILALQTKLQENEEEFTDAPLSIEVRMGDGRYVERANPVVQEYRAMVRDYASALKAYKELTNDQGDAEVDQLGDLRAKFKVMG